MSPSLTMRKSAWASAGSVLAAIIASACCWLPLLLIVVGASAAGVAAFFERARPWFLGGSVVLLAAGFYLNYFRRETCNEGETCATPNPRLQRSSRIMLWVATVAVLAFALFPSYVGALLGGTSAEADSATPMSVTLAVDGMTCGGCATTVEQALLKVPGVHGASVDYDKRRAVVTLDLNAPASTSNLIAAVKWTGYTASLPTDAGSDATTE